MRAGGELKRSQPSDELRDMLKMETALRKRPQNSSPLFGFAVAACKTVLAMKKLCELPIHLFFIQSFLKSRGNIIFASHIA